MLLSSVGLDIPGGPPVIETSTIVISMTVGVVVTRRCRPCCRPGGRSKVPPIAALRDVAVDRSAGSKRRAVDRVSRSPPLGVAALLGGLERWRRWRSSASVRSSCSSASRCSDRCSLGRSRRVLGYPLAKLRGMSGVLARQNAMRNPKRTARTAASLMIGVGLVAFITIFAASAKTSIAGSLDNDYHGTHIVDSGAFDSSAGLQPRARRRRCARPPACAWCPKQRVTKAEVDGSATDILMAFDPTTIGAAVRSRHVEGDRSTSSAPTASPSRPKEATAHGWTLGDTRHGDLPERARRRSWSRPSTTTAPSGSVPSSSASTAFAGNVPTALDARVYVATDDAAALEAAARRYPTAEVLDKQGFLAEKNAEIDMMLKLIYAMLALAVLIALLGIANTLALSIYERKRELGLLRAVGMSRAQVRSSVRWESVIIALFGTALGLGIGVFFGWAMVGALSDQGIDTLTIPASGLLRRHRWAARSPVSAAAIMPARRAARLDVLKAVATG